MKLKKFLPCLALCLVFSVSGCYRGDYPYYAWDGTVCSTFWGQDPDDPDSIMVPNYYDWAEVEAGNIQEERVDYVLDITITDIADIDSVQTAMDDEYAAYNEETGETKDRYYYFTPYHFYIDEVVYQSEEAGGIDSLRNEMLEYNDEPYYTDSEGNEHLQYFLFLWGISCNEPGICYSNTEKAFVGAKYRMVLKCRGQVEYYSDYGETSLYPYHIFFTSVHGCSIRLLENDTNNDDQYNRWLSDEPYDIFRDGEKPDEGEDETLTNEEDK